MDAQNPFMALGLGVLLILLIVNLILAVLVLICHWILFTKAGQPGWATLIPFYSLVVLLKIVGRPASWIAWYFQVIPFIILYIFYPSFLTALVFFLSAVAGLVFAIVVTNGVSKSFGKSEGFTVGLILLPVVFYPILAFGPSKYIGPGGIAPEGDYF